MLQADTSGQHRARKLRSEMTLPEIMLWQRLRRRPGGLKFRRQHPAGPYVLDFYCHEARLIVEIDGIAHDMGDRPQHDDDRDAAFISKGFRIMRVPAKDVLRDPDGVAATIAEVGMSQPGEAA